MTWVWTELKAPGYVELVFVVIALSLCYTKVLIGLAQELSFIVDTGVVLVEPCIAVIDERQTMIWLYHQYHYLIKHPKTCLLYHAYIYMPVMAYQMPHFFFSVAIVTVIGRKSPIK